MDFPLESIHPKAFKAHESGNCAGDQGKFWEMHERIFENNRALELKDLKGHAETIGLNLEEFQECMDSGKHVDEIRKDIAEGKKAGVRGTPTFFLGLTGPDDTKIKATKLIRGAQAFPSFKTAIDELLSEKKK
jgi:protein-disulfide isomerase